ncbi:DUF6429 family protein [Sphingobium aquiterrae]|uniref:DUF6429 family protein n=1 Tax=Sphingobium aquiterrae TaxID=2038656 RepID=UPI003017136F|tara:strand:+ start:29080 stop:29337 length:258 start_codon:yes stop_codon:yes gene_type:complete
MHHADIDTDKIDEAVLALMFLTRHNEDRLLGTVRAWKSFDWDALDRLHAQNMILDPVGKAKSVVLTPEGCRRSEELFYRLFAKRV